MGKTYADVLKTIADTYKAHESSKTLGTRTWTLPEVEGDPAKNARIVWELVINPIAPDILFGDVGQNNSKSTAMQLRASLHMDDYVGPVDVMRLRPMQLNALSIMHQIYEAWMTGELEDLPEEWTVR